MTDRPIIFSAPMVRALLDGRKTQTRRVLKPRPRRTIFFDPAKADSDQFQPPRYATGDRLYVREAFAKDSLMPNGVRYVATDDINELRKKRPSIHMPRWASRLTLIVTEVRVQRLQDISEADAAAEGVEAKPFPGPWWQGYKDLGEGNLLHQQFLGETPPDWMIEPKRMPPTPWLDRTAKDGFRDLWNSLHGPDAWDANPWVVALTFTVQHGNIDQLSQSPARGGTGPGPS